MTKLTTLPYIVLLLSGLAAAQASGQATAISGYATPGGYSAPAVPLIHTPSMTLGAPLLQVGISDATADDDIRATASSYKSDGYDWGAARSEDSYGVAELASGFHPGKAAKVYTNLDVAQVNDTNGLVKYGNKTEHL